MRKITFKNYPYILTVLVVISTSLVSAQDRAARWQRTEPREQTDLQLFHSQYAGNLPTAETLQRHDLEFEIAHRFYPEFTSGYDGMFGLDGPANIRFGLTYAPANRALVSIGRTSYNDNLDLSVKYKLLQIRNNTAPVLLAAKGGFGWNTGVSGRPKSDSKNFQYFGQFIANTMIRKKLGIGIVTSYLNNSDIYSVGNEYIVTMGVYGQVYFSPLWSMFVEWNPRLAGERPMFNPCVVGFELETGGHFFKLLLTNSVLLNTSQHLAGAEYEFTKDELRFGFSITRLLDFTK